MTYYLKYRPQVLSDLNLRSVRESLSKIIESKTTPHAFLFAGPKGTGKTSAARILAKIVNCEKNIKKYAEPCNSCSICTSIAAGKSMDVIEIDAASHRGIDDIRIINEAVGLSPAAARKKVYIIDEAHMLTTEASNALLKTLEEPPEHVVFVLATTNPEKLIPTIRSRTTLVKFSKATDDEIVESLERIVKAEKLKIKKESLLVISKYSDGSFRDATKILEQLVVEDVLDASKIDTFLGNKGQSEPSMLVKLVIDRKTKEALQMIENLAESGVVFTDLIKEILILSKKELLFQNGIGEGGNWKIEQKDLTLLIEALMDANIKTKSAVIEQLPLELAVISWINKTKNKNDDDEVEEPRNNVESLQGPAKKKLTTEKVELKISQADAKEIDKKDLQINSTPVENMSEDVWKQILEAIRGVNYSVEALLRAAKPVQFIGDTLTLGVYYQFHKERLEEIRNREILEQVVAKVLSKPTKVICTLTQPDKVQVATEVKPKPILADADDADIVKVAKDIFGS